MNRAPTSANRPAFQGRCSQKGIYLMPGLPSTNLPLIRRGAPLLFAAGALGAALLAGCGGGGSNGNTSIGGTTGTGTTGTGTTGTGTSPVLLNADVTGKITDANGNGVPGATIIPDTGGAAVISLGQGGYRLNGLSGNTVHRITASVQNGGTQYTGSTEVLTQGGFLVSNANILLSPTGRQATVSGTVRNAARIALAGVRVFLTVPNGSASQVGQYSSLVAFSDGSGVYTIPNVPSDKPTGGGGIIIAASTPGLQNQSFALATLQPGGSYGQDFALNPSTGVAVGAPALAYVTASTEPTNSQGGRAVQAHVSGSGPASVYDQLRRRLSPFYARTADRTAATSRRLSAHAIGDYAIETDVAFDNPAQTSSVVGNTVYRTTGTTLPIESQGDAYDFLQDPLANYYTDVTFSTNQSTTVGGTQYNFALSATNTDSQETGLSSILSITPLGTLTLSTPTPGQTFVGSATINWTPTTGAVRYVVFIYNQYPTIGLSPTLVSATLPAGTATYTTPTLNGGLDYYAVVVGASDQNEALLPTAGTNAVTGAALTFSQITRFHIQ